MTFPARPGLSLLGDGLEPCGPFPCHAELPFERQSHLPDQSIVEQAADDCDPVRHSTWRIELRQRTGRIRRPVTSRFRDLYEPGAHSERRMTRVVRDRELLVAERRHDQQVDLFEDARHFQRNFSTKSIRLYKVNRGKKSRLAE